MQHIVFALHSRGGMTNHYTGVPLIKKHGAAPTNCCQTLGLLWKLLLPIMALEVVINVGDIQERLH